MDTLILGLLLLKDRTLYEIRKLLSSSSIQLLYSCSTGSIQAAIKKLVTNAYVTAEEVEEHGRTKKVYTITDAGRAYFEQWINSEFSMESNRNQELTKFYFMGFSKEEFRRERLENHVENLKKAYECLRVVYEEGKKTVAPKELEDVFRYQLLTAKYGMDSAAFQIKWFEETMKELWK
ncbi:MAG: PadR family transcriptional regulator [bacterium]|nr:PadR family transcriptional regulator [bacterium]